MSIFAGRLSRKNFGLGVLMLLAIPLILAVILASLSDARLKAQQANMQTSVDQQKIQDAIDQMNTQQSSNEPMQTP